MIPSAQNAVQSPSMRKAFLLGAGLGTRLRPMTDTLPKPLIPVFHRPLITHVLDHCLAANIRDFAINTHHLPEMWDIYFPDRRYKEATLTFFHEPILLETGGGIKNIEEWIGNDSVLVYNGDILTDCKLSRLIDTHEEQSNGATLGIRSTGDICNLEIDGDRVIDIRNQLGKGEGTHQFTGIYCISPEILPLIPANEKISVRNALVQLAAKGALGSTLLDDSHWLDLGTRETYLRTHGLGNDRKIPELLDGQTAVHPEAKIDPTATISNSVIGSQCEIGPDAIVENSLLWPKTTVAPGARLTNCILHSTNPVSGHHDNADL